VATTSSSAATERRVAVWVALALAASMGLLAVRLSAPPAAGPAYPPAGPACPPGPPQIPPLRVLVAPSTVERLRVRVDGPYRVTARGDWRVLAQGSRLPEADVAATEAGLQIGPRVFEPRELAIHAVRPGSACVAGVRYHGDLHLLRRGKNQVAVVNAVELEQYVADVLDGLAATESPGEYPAAFRDALAIIVRSQAMYRMKTFGPGSDWDVEEGLDALPYRGVPASDGTGPNGSVAEPPPRRAADPTHGIVLAYRGALFCPLSTEVCGGHTVDGRLVFRDAAPPLVGVRCEFCREAEEYRWQRSIPAHALLPRLADWLTRSGRDPGLIERIAGAEPPPGVLSEIRVTGASGEASVSANVFRLQAAGVSALPSPQFAVRLVGETLEFSGRGRGPGAGLCRCGARRQAMDGRSTTEILAYYFPESELITVR
jgi:SpoIID/LytB domain protein